ncbi:M28 family peptidase [Cardinium endosymbiont of Philonthus spinipes]|uniref:M28 family peptidase n=1 Tax=Cardinium endosymbiont of Philonthus spinipes TaxID=3077941 RepID=UPI00313CF4B7
MNIFNDKVQYSFYFAALLIGCSVTTSNALPTGSLPVDRLISENKKMPIDETLKEQLKEHITVLSKIGPRNIENPFYYQRLCQTAQYIINALKESGLQPNTTTYSATYKDQQFDVQNIEVVIPCNESISNDMEAKNNRALEYIVIGAHYDTVRSSPGADDNGSGIAVLLEIARHLHNLDQNKIKRTIKLVAFPNEECPYSVDPKTKKFFGSNMGSVQYAKQAKERGEKITGMISLESISYFSNEPNSQIYPWYLKWLKYFYGNRGNFLMILGDLKSKPFQKKWMSCYKKIGPKSTTIHAIALPGWLPNVYRSDHGSFSLEGFPAFMITDTANFRNPHYHQTTDTVDTIDFSHFTKATKSLIATIERLALDDPLQP